MGPLLGPLKATGPMMGPLKSMGPGVIVPSCPPLTGPERRTTSLIYPRPISVFWIDGSVPTKFVLGGAGVLFYSKSKRTRHYFPSPTVRFHPASPQRSQPYVMPLDGAFNITPLSIHVPGCLYKLPVLLHHSELYL